jgi:AraC-like DNA-binding protein
MTQLSASIKSRICELMTSASRAMGLRLCFHDRFNQAGLPREWTTHCNPACDQVKLAHHAECVAYDVFEVHSALSGSSVGRIHTCPFGFTDIAVPVRCAGLQVDVLFAGPCWTGNGPPPHPWLKIPPDPEWLQDRRVLLQAVAHELGRLLEGEQPQPLSGRRRLILNFLQDMMHEPVTLPDLAAELGLSPSRTGHLVRDLFDCTFPALVHDLKLREAASLLSNSALPVGRIATHLGYHDQSYFCRLFSRRYGCNPGCYRKKHPPEA